MAETSWTEEGTEGLRKRKIPTWAWFCGGGCLLAILITAAVVIVGIQFGKKAVDADYQKQKLAQILPFDELPSNMRFMIGLQIPTEQYTFQDESHGLQLQIQHMT